MAKVKEVLSSEVHWQVAGWNTKDQANIRIRQLLGNEAAMFAPVYVTHGGYYWADAASHGWSLLSDASYADTEAVLDIIDDLRQRTIARFPAQKGRIEQVFSWPNNDFVFWHRTPDGLKVLVTGWGFASYNRARGGSIVEAPDESNIRDVSLVFTVDGVRCPDRAFEIFQGITWMPHDTSADGLFELGRLTPGEEVLVRDLVSGRECKAVVGDDTAVIDFDVTEYIDVTVNASRDGKPVDGDTGKIDYGHRSEEFVLREGFFRRSMPWLGNEKCVVSVRGQRQTRVLVKDSVNEFYFDFSVATMNLTVSVSGDGAPIAGEPVSFSFSGSVRKDVTGADGTCTSSFEFTGDKTAVIVSVRDRMVEVPLAEGPQSVDFVFDTPPAELFDAVVRTVNLDGDIVPFYPITVDTGSGPVELLTDDKACASVGTVRHGALMTVSDTSDARVRTDFQLDRDTKLYDFVLPYRGEPVTGDCLLRVIEADGKPSEGTTAILSQGENRVMAHLDSKGEMCFDSTDFEFDKPVKVGLFSPRRTFPELSFVLDKNEKEYELKEVTGPTPWWKIAGEIALVLGSVFGLWLMYHIGYNLIRLI